VFKVPPDISLPCGTACSAVAAALGEGGFCILACYYQHWRCESSMLVRSVGASPPCNCDRACSAVTVLGTEGAQLWLWQLLRCMVVAQHSIATLARVCPVCCCAHPHKHAAAAQQMHVLLWLVWCSACLCGPTLGKAFSDLFQVR
jgi:hypothetical protein